MTTVQLIAIYFSAAAAVGGIVAAAVGLIAIMKNRDLWYTAHHAEFLDRKQRVERDLKRGRND